MDRRRDTDLKIIIAAGAACRLAIALTSVSAALRVWAVGLEAGSLAEVVGGGGSPPLQSIRTVDFLAEAAVDQAKLMAHSVTAHRSFCG